MFEWKTGDEGWDEAVEDVLSSAGEERSKPSRPARLIPRLAPHWPTLLGLGVAAAVIAVVLMLNRTWEPAGFVKVGRVEDFPPGSVTPMQLPAAAEDWDPSPIGSQTPGVVTQVPAKWVSPIPIFLVHDPADGFLALYNRDPHLGCRTMWIEADERPWVGVDQRFVTPCHGEQYMRTGECIAGPCPRGLDRFRVQVVDGQVIVDVRQLMAGPPREE